MYGVCTKRVRERCSVIVAQTAEQQQQNARSMQQMNHVVHCGVLYADRSNWKKKKKTDNDRLSFTENYFRMSTYRFVKDTSARAMQVC